MGVATWGDQEGCPALVAWEQELDAHGAAPMPSVATHERTDAPEKVRDLIEAAGLEVVGIEGTRGDLPLSREEFWEQRLRLSTSRARLDSLGEEARAACLAGARRRLDALADGDFVDRSQAILAVARGTRAT